MVLRINTYSSIMKDFDVRVAHRIRVAMYESLSLPAFDTRVLWL